MSAFIREQVSGELSLGGVLDHASGAALREEGRRLVGVSGAAALIVDCSAVERSTSVGLSLLLCLMRDARAQGKTLAVRALPAELGQLAGVSGLHEILTPS